MKSIKRAFAAVAAEKQYNQLVFVGHERAGDRFPVFGEVVMGQTEHLLGFTAGKLRSDITSFLRIDNASADLEAFPLKNGLAVPTPKIHLNREGSIPGTVFGALGLNLLDAATMSGAGSMGLEHTNAESVDKLLLEVETKMHEAFKEITGIDPTM